MDVPGSKINNRHVAARKKTSQRVAILSLVRPHAVLRRHHLTMADSIAMRAAQSGVTDKRQQNFSQQGPHVRT